MDAIRHRPLRTASAILNRLNEITMNTSLRHELRLIGFIQRMIASGALTGAARINVHMIDAEDVMLELGIASKMNGYDGLTLASPTQQELGRCRCRLKPSPCCKAAVVLVRIEEGHYKPELAKLVNACSGAAPGAANGASRAATSLKQHRARISE